MSSPSVGIQLLSFAKTKYLCVAESRLETIQIGLYPVHFYEEGVCVLPSLKVISKDFLTKMHSEEVRWCFV